MVSKKAVDLPAKNYFSARELVLLIQKIEMFVNMNEAERSRDHRNTDANKARIAVIDERISEYRDLRDKLMELASARNTN